MAGVKERASEGLTHWYTAEGLPAYTVIGKNGKERNTTLRDARALHLVPSVTGILQMANKPGLNNWIIDKNILAALTLPKLEDESEEDWIKRVKEDAKQEAIKAAERGTRIHSAIQRGFEGEKLEGEDEIYFHIASEEIRDAIRKLLF